MLVALGLLAAGAVILYAGAEAAVRGGAGLARALGVRAFVIGALLFGIDVEGLGAAVVAAARDQTELAAGEIFGTVVFLFSVAFGAALIATRRPVPSPEPLMVLAPSLHVTAGAFAISDRFVDRLEGGFLVVLYLAYAALVVRTGRIPESAAREVEREAAEAPRSRGALLGLTLVGLALVVGGAAILVAGGVRLVDEAGLAAGFVGAAVLGIVVSLDEVLLEMVPMVRGSPELATGNLFGTLAAFTTGVLGITALVRPLQIDAAGSAAFLAAAFLYAVVAIVFIVRGSAGRVLGAFVLGSYGVWLLAASRI